MMIRALKIALWAAVGYVWGRSHAQARLDRASPDQLRAIANEVEQHQQHWNRAYPRRQPSFSRRLPAEGDAAAHLDTDRMVADAALLLSEQVRQGASPDWEGLSDGLLDRMAQPWLGNCTHPPEACPEAIWRCPRCQARRELRLRAGATS
jgi:hypothetical protein